MNLNAPARLGIFAIALGASLGVGLAVGAAVGPVDDDRPPSHEVDHQPSTTIPPRTPSTTTPAPSTAVDHSQMGHSTTEVLQP